MNTITQKEIDVKKEEREEKNSKDLDLSLKKGGNLEKINYIGIDDLFLFCLRFKISRLSKSNHLPTYYKIKVFLLSPLYPPFLKLTRTQAKTPVDLGI